MQSRKPTQIRFKAPADAVAQLHKLKQGAPTPWLIGLTGPQGAGKTTIARILADELGGTILSTDAYLPDYSVIPASEVDKPEHADLPLLAEHLYTLTAGNAILKPIWSFHEHRRTGVEEFHPAPVVICEGIHALHPDVREHLHLAIYLDAHPDIRWRRVEDRESSGARGFGVERAKTHFDTVAEPTFLANAEQYRALADIVLENHDAHEHTDKHEQGGRA